MAPLAGLPGAAVPATHSISNVSWRLTVINLLVDDLPAPIAHGGNLREVVRRYGIPQERWIDLSTGINPDGYPVPSVDAESWRRLPDDDDDLEEVAAWHYGAARALVTPGTQAAIRMLPKLLPRGRIGLGLVTYGEYERAFVADGFQAVPFVTEQFEDARDETTFLLKAGTPLPSDLQYLVLVNPNNPGGECFAPHDIMAWHSELRSRGGVLIVDEAFIDATPEYSVASQADCDSLVVLRSVGKFFGLGGARVGVVHSGERVDRALRYLRGQWTVSGPSRAVTRAALLDKGWQEQMKSRLANSSARLVGLLKAYGLGTQCTRTPLFAWTRDLRAAEWQDRLARNGVWVRRFDSVPGLRLGLPGNEYQWTRVEQALKSARSDLSQR